MIKLPVTPAEELEMLINGEPWVATYLWARAEGIPVEAHGFRLLLGPFDPESWVDVFGLTDSGWLATISTDNVILLTRPVALMCHVKPHVYKNGFWHDYASLEDLKKWRMKNPR